MTMRTRRGSLAGIVAAALMAGCVLMAGCAPAGPTRVSVTGTVKFDGQPVEDGTIGFLPTGDTKGPGGGGRIQNGAFTLTSENGPVVGKQKVEIRATRKTGEKMPAIPPATGEIEKVEEYIPAKYNTATTLEREIKPGENKLDFDLAK